MRVEAALSLVVFGRPFVLLPNALLELLVVERQLKFTLVGVDLYGISLPRVLVEQQLQELARGPEEEANAAIAEVERHTGMQLSGVSLTAEAMVLDFQGMEPQKMI